jgi:hypothetical protein
MLRNIRSILKRASYIDLKIKLIVSPVLLCAVGGCTLAPQEPFANLNGAAPPSGQIPDSLGSTLEGFGDLRLGMSIPEVASLGYSISSDSDPYVSSNPKVYGINFVERGNFTGYPLQLSNIVLLLYTEINTDASGNQTCDFAQTIFNALSQKYGAEYTEYSSTAYAEGYTYTWTFKGGRYIREDAFKGQCPDVVYSEPNAPVKDQNATF